GGVKEFFQVHADNNRTPLVTSCVGNDRLSPLESHRRRVAGQPAEYPPEYAPLKRLQSIVGGRDGARTARALGDGELPVRWLHCAEFVRSDRQARGLFLDIQMSRRF